MRKSFLSYSGVLVLIVVVILVNGVSRNLFSRWYLDLTEDRLYSLSQGTKNILRSIQDPITLKFYFSKMEGAKYPGVNLYGNRIGDLLREYERKSRGKIVLEVYDPRPDSEEEDWAQKYGLTPLPLRTGEELYLGLVATNALGEEEVIPIFNFNRQEFLEYDITKTVYALANTKKPVVGVISSLDLQGDPAAMRMQRGGGEKEPWFFTTQLAQSADVRFLPPTAETIDADVGVLLLVHPKNLGDATLYAIDQHVMRGGKLVVLEDPFCEGDRPQPDENNPMAQMAVDRSSSLNRLLSKWGVELIDGQVVGDIGLATRVDSGEGNPRNFVLWLSLHNENVNKDDLITSALDDVLFPWAGALKVTPVEGVTVETLLKTTAEAQLTPVDAIRMNGGDPEALLRQYVAGGVEYPLAVRIRGKLKTNFPGGKPGAQADQSSKDHLIESKENANIVVFSDVDFAANRFSVASQNLLGTRLISLVNDNMNLVLNCVENLSGSDDLIGMRTRGRFSRPFTVVNAMEVQAQQQWQLEEMRLQAELNTTNQRLSQLQNSVGRDEQGGKQVLSAAVLDEVKKFREQRRQAQQRLREVRRNLRQGIEHLGTLLFALNTFLVPLALVMAAFGYYIWKARKRA